MVTYLQGRKIAADERPSPKVVLLIRKLRWLGMETEAEQVLQDLREDTPTGGVITAAGETD
jgi:hypothetical protein